MHVDGTTDDTALLSACVASTLPGAGGTILIGPGQVKLASTLTITKNHVTLQGVGGMGSDDPDDVGNGPATQIVCGATPCIVFQGVTSFPNNPPNQPYNQNVITGTGLRDLGMYGQSAYATALKTIDEWNAIPLQNVTIRDFNGGYAVLVTSDVNEATCSSRHLIFDNVKFASTNGTNTAASGIQFGEFSGGHEVCSMEVSNLISELSEAPGTHQILLDYTDTSTFTSLNLNGAGSTIAAVSSIVADPTGSNPTVTTSSPHGMPVTGVDDGVYLVAGCSIPPIYIDRLGVQRDDRSSNSTDRWPAGPPERPRSCYTASPGSLRTERITQPRSGARRCSSTTSAAPSPSARCTR